MGNLVFQATLGGQVNLVGPNTASTYNINVPSVNGNLVTTGDTGTVTNTMLAGSIANAKLTNSSVTVGSTSIALGATSTTLDGVNIGATTAGTGAFTTLSASSTVSGTGFSTYLASPPAIGGTAAAAGSFTTLSASSTLSVTGSGTIQGLTVGKGGGAVSTNTAVGASALNANTSGSNNTAVGYQAGNSNTTGNGGIFIGQGAGTTRATTGDFNILIGTTAQNSATGGSYEIVIGTNNPTGKGSSTGFINAGGGGVYQGNNSATWSVTSDRRLKKNIVDNTEGLEKITAIRVRNFEYKLPEEVTELDPTCAIERTGVQLGVIAQELLEVCGDCVKEESTGVMSVNSDNLTWHMVNAIKDLKALNDALTARVVALEAK